MTEAEWLACNDPQAMLEFLEGKASDRKLRLFACACCRRIWPLFTDPRSRRAVQVAERFADAEGVSLTELAAAERDAEDAHIAAPHLTALGLGPFDAAIHVLNHDLSASAADAASRAADAVESQDSNSGETARREECRFQALLVRCVFGNPFRPAVIDPAIFRWNDGTVVKLARAIYDERTFDRLVILADALEDAGCNDTQILGHCRGPGPHVRGCWLVDLLLGKE
jgi:hypothetical protein